MLGVEEDPGVMIRTMDELFRRVEEYRDSKIIDVTISYLEVYNETIRDLLTDTSIALELREDPERGMIVAGLSEHKPTDTAHLLQLLAKGNTHRSQSPTDANAQSSRSHAVLQIKIEQRDRTANISTDVRFAKLSLIDLAGSERASVTKNRGERLLEGANINRSLLALGNCINALGGKSKRHIPYRDSKLTRLLKDSLGGNCFTVMIANISPSRLHYEDTHNTLKYANRAKEIRVKVEQNIMSVQYHISQYTQIIAQLREEIHELKEKLEKYERADVLLYQRPINSFASATSTMIGNSMIDSHSDAAWHDQIVEAFKERRSLHTHYLNYCKTVQLARLRKAYLESLDRTVRNLLPSKRSSHRTPHLVDHLASALDLANRAHQTARVQLANVESNLDHNQIRMQSLKTDLAERLTHVPAIYHRLVSDIDTVFSDTGTWISVDMNDLMSQSVALQSTHIDQLLHAYSMLWSILPESTKDSMDSFSNPDSSTLLSSLLKTVESDDSFFSQHPQHQQPLPTSHEFATIPKSSTIDADRKRRRTPPSLSNESVVSDPSSHPISSSSSISSSIIIDSHPLSDNPSKILNSPKRQPLIASSSSSKRRLTRSPRSSSSSSTVEA
jgi:hypothetical protein